MSETSHLVRSVASCQGVGEVPFVTTSEEADAFRTARWLYAMRERRASVLGVSIFAEPAWDLLLDLYISRATGRRLSVTAACIGARTATATAIRYVGLLAEAGILDRTPDDRDSRRSFVALSDRGWIRMTRLLIR